MDIDWQDLEDTICVRIWKTNDVEKHAAELCAEIAVNEFKKVLKAMEPKIEVVPPIRHNNGCTIFSETHKCNCPVGF